MSTRPLFACLLGLALLLPVAPTLAQGGAAPAGQKPGEPAAGSDKGKPAGAARERLKAAAKKAAETHKATSCQTPFINVDILRSRLLPMTKEELEREVKAWLDVLRAQVEAISEAEIAARKGSGGDNLQALRDDRTRLVDRLNVTLIELEKKGGDPKDAAKYVSAVSGLNLDVRDVNALRKTAIAWAKSPEGGLRWVRNIVFFILTLIVFKLLSWIVGRAVRTAVNAAGTGSDLLRDFFVYASQRATTLIGLVVGLSMLEVNIGPFVAAIGAVGFVVAFALQGTLSNFAAGVMILLYRPYDIGNFVTVGGVTGTVNSMNLVSTKLVAPDNQVIIVPNSSIWGGVITNVTGSETRRIDLVMGIGYDDDIPTAEKVFERILKEHPKVLAEPAPTILLSELADSSVNFVVRPWVKTSDYFTTKCELTRSIKLALDEAGISIPYPQQDVWMHQVESTPQQPAAAASEAVAPAAAPAKPEGAADEGAGA